MSETSTLTLTDFLLARITEDEAAARDAGADAMVGARWKSYPREAYEELQGETLAHCRRMLAECEAKRRIVEMHRDWPVLVAQPDEFEPSFGADLPFPDQITMRMSRQIAWMTEQEYRNRFSDEPPTGPIIRVLAAVYADHPDYREEWA